VGKYAIQLGGDELYNTARRFGIGQKMRIGLPGETRGRIDVPPHWSDYTISAFAMGHAVAVNALQMAAGFAAIANGGELLRPHLILGHVDDEGYIADRRSREVIGRVARRESIDTLKAVLRGVVEVGTATPVQSAVISIAGKTGTAEIPNLVNGGYYKSKFIGSFAGFFPYEQPLVAGIVMLVEPHPIHYGGWTAGPTFRKIAERYARLNAEMFTPSERILVQKSDELETTAQVPDLMGRNVDAARAQVAQCGLNLRSNSDSGFVQWQFPAADRMIVQNDDVLVAISSAKEDSLCMVDLVGLSIREASAWLDHLGVMFTIEGRGRVVKQSILPGAVLNHDETCRLKCRS
jgi:outer membrane protein assembly factor BamB